MSNLGNENKLRRRLKMRKQEGFKQIILDSLDNVNKSKPKNFEIALQELNKIFSDIKGFISFLFPTFMILFPSSAIPPEIVSSDVPVKIVLLYNTISASAKCHSFLTYKAFSPRSPVLIRTASSIGLINIFPSPT